jgi:hypothetical protein
MSAPIENRRLLVELAPADDAFLHVLVVIDAPQHQIKRRYAALMMVGRSGRNART